MARLPRPVMKLAQNHEAMFREGIQDELLRVFRFLLQKIHKGLQMGGRIGDTIEFFYLDTEKDAHFVAESGSGHAIELTPVRQYPPAEK